MKPKNSLTKNAPDKKPFSAIITGDSMQNMIRKALGSPSAAARFTSTLISVVSASENMRNCEPNSIIACALRGEGMGLTFGEGYYVVPFGSVATFVPGYKGLIQRSIATGKYADIDVILVREGERKGRDPRTGHAIIDLSTYDSDEEREKHPIIGVKAYFLLRDGFYREEFWTTDEILRHADRYSKAFSLSIYNKWKNGATLGKDELVRVKGPYEQFVKWRNGEDVDPKLAKEFSELGAWYDEGGRQINMMKKTVLRSLLNSGYAPLSSEVRSLIQADAAEGVVPDINIPMDFTVDKTTGEYIENETIIETENEADDKGAGIDEKPQKSEAAVDAKSEDLDGGDGIFGGDDGNESFFGD